MVQQAWISSAGLALDIVGFCFLVLEWRRGWRQANIEERLTLMRERLLETKEDAVMGIATEERHRAVDPN